MHFVYILECADGSLYTGYTNDVERRFDMHVAGRGAKYTISHKPTKILYTEHLKTLSAALKRERKIKKLPRLDKLDLIQSSANHLLYD